jgi:hypothetical protein
MQASDLWEFNNVTDLGRLNGPGLSQPRSRALSLHYRQLLMKGKVIQSDSPDMTWR